PRAREAVSQDLLDAAVPRVRRGAARLSVHALGQPDLHAAWVEGAVLPDRRPLLRLVAGVLRRRRLGVLGEPAGSALPQLQDALGLRALGRPQARREPRRRPHDDSLAASGRPQAPPRGVTRLVGPRRAAPPAPTRRDRRWPRRAMARPQSG